MIVPIPISDEPNPPQTAWATYALIAVNTAIFVFITLPAGHQPAPLDDPRLAEYVAVLSRVSGLSAAEVLHGASRWDLWVFSWGFRPSIHAPLTLITSQFLHAGWMHLGGNMLMLYIFGDNVEARLGRLRYVMMYLGTGAAAAIFYGLARPHNELPLLGASGAISGVLGCYYIWFPNNRVRILALIFVFVTSFRLPARTVLLFYLVIENLLPFVLEHGAKGGVAYGAHVGGFFAGALMAHHLAKPVRQGAGTSKRKRMRDAQLHRTEQLCLHGELAQAHQSYAQLDVEDSMALNAEALLVFADRLTEDGQYGTALAVLRRMIVSAEHKQDDVFARAHIRAGFIEWRANKRLQAAHDHFAAALQARPSLVIARGAQQSLVDVQRELSIQ